MYSGESIKVRSGDLEMRVELSIPSLSRSQTLYNISEDFKCSAYLAACFSHRKHAGESREPSAPR
jgi:hypothetical protein